MAVPILAPVRSRFANGGWPLTVRATDGDCPAGAMAGRLDRSQLGEGDVARPSLSRFIIVAAVVVGGCSASGDVAPAISDDEG
jgi:hypothetical protein